MLPKISVIVPAYNAELTICQCIESIEKQTYENLEIIIVNDGSSDNTQEKIDELMTKYDNISTLYSGNKGVSVTRNLGLKAVNSEYFTFVDADDMILPDMIKVLYKGMEETNADVVGCSFFRWTSKDVDTIDWSKKTDISSIPNRITVYEPQQFLLNQIFGKNNSRCWSKLYKKEVINDLTFDDDVVVGEDILFLVKLLFQIDKIAEIEYEGYGYYINLEGAMLRPFSKRYMDQIVCWEKVREKAALMDEKTSPIATRNLIMAIMLIVGKLAELDRIKLNENKECVDICHEKLKVQLKEYRGKELLDRGYKIKSFVFLYFPKLYLTLYHFHKYMK